MYGKMIGLTAAVVVVFFAVGCGDTCRELCGFEADYFADCIIEWNHTWEDLGYESKSDFRQSCMDAANTARDQVGDCCVDAETDEDRTECEKNALLAIDRQCEDTKEYFRQPCSDYWQEVFVLGGPGFPEDNPTCQGDDDTADDDTSGGGDDDDTSG